MGVGLARAGLTLLGFSLTTAVALATVDRPSTEFSILAAATAAFGVAGLLALAVAGTLWVTERLATRRSPHGDQLWLNWAVHRKREQDYIGTLQATVSADQRAAIAYMLHSAFWGKGYAQEACRRLLTMLFTAYDLRCVYAEVDTRNQASWRLLERLGFQRVAFRQAADHFKGASSDEYTYELTAKDWQASRPGSTSA
jgi:RimJ/RimL family protein N-acetyltransferase